MSATPRRRIRHPDPADQRQRGDVIQSLRTIAGLQRPVLAARCSISPLTLSNIERNRQQASWITLYAIARELGVPITMFLRDPADLPHAEVVAAAAPKACVA